MDRDQITQTIALLVVLLGIARWMPLIDVMPPWFGAEDPLHAVRLDDLAASEDGRGADGSSDPVRAMLRAGNPRRTPHFTRWLTFAHEIKAATPDDAVVQLKGISRNEGWILAYDLYPRHVIGEAKDHGGTTSDATDASANVVIVGGPAPYWEHVR